jgi:SAM-dependent methyltransferase
MTRAAGALARLRRRMIPSEYAALELGTGSWVACAVAAFCELGLPAALEREPQSAEELSAAGFGAHDRLFRLLRDLAAYGVTHYAGGGRFTLGHAGKGLVGETSAVEMIRYANAPWHLAGYGGLADGIRSDRSGMQCASGMSLFDFNRRHPQAGALFDRAMYAHATLHAPALAAAYDFSACRRVVDVGGGTGITLACILQRFPKAEATLFEMPESAAHAKQAALDARIAVVEGDMFADPLPHGDVYVMSHLLHDWDDAACVRILSNARRAMPDRSRLLLFECIAPRPGNAWSQDRLSDLEMLTMLPGRERTREEFEALLASAQLRLLRVIPAGAPESILEAAAAQSR